MGAYALSLVASKKQTRSVGIGIAMGTAVAMSYPWISKNLFGTGFVEQINYELAAQNYVRDVLASF